jgi:tetrahydromethanopterin S-methyltransferase subunit C
MMKVGILTVCMTIVHPLYACGAPRAELEATGSLAVQIAIATYISTWTPPASATSTSTHQH